MKFKARCRACQEKFSTSTWPPLACPACGHVEDPDNDDRICMPSIRTMRMSKTDQVYRDMERASEQRVYAAAEMAGCSPSDMVDLKITNLNDRRDAEIAAIPVSNPVTQQMEYVNARGGQFGFQPGGAAHMAAVEQGAVITDGHLRGRGMSPSAGAHARVNLQRALPPVGSPPEPLEVQQPGYRRRA